MTRAQLCRILTCAAFFAVGFAVCLAWSGGGPLIQAAYGLVLALAILGVYLFVAQISDIWRNFLFLLTWFVGVMLVFDLLASADILKAQFLQAWYVIYTVGIALFYVLAFVIATALQLLCSQRDPHADNAGQA
ncbi:MAG: hypothetical protein QNI93_08775 [Kiloniellales bacterium]|nr:hypothetical protein [Kiloniellales bacterium]